jgi:hypothetical protein
VTKAVLVGLVPGLLALGCSDDEPAQPDPSPSATATTSESTGDPAPTAESSTPTETGTAGSEGPVAATGLLLEEESSQLNVPEGEWERIPDIVDYASAAGYVPSTDVISLSDRESFSSPATLDEQVKFHDRTLPEGAVVERQPDVLLDGEPAYYVQWYEKGDTKIQHDIGLDRGGRTIAIQLDLDRSDPAATDALIAAVLASFRWK